ncbi:MAG: hypothetical protein HYZ34_15005 [Ignavibacteriae bacterium]|nr:hypothetical protein [Ignavibacteriota bacterium]
MNVPKVTIGSTIEFYEYRNGFTYEAVSKGEPFFESSFFSEGTKTVFLEILTDGKEHFVTWDEDNNLWKSGYADDYIPDTNSESIQ